jgi:hypothetical protein
MFDNGSVDGVRYNSKVLDDMGHQFATSTSFTAWIRKISLITYTFILS